MIIGAHSIIYSRDSGADRAFLRDVLGFPSVDAGHGWLIFALPPAEVAVHPTEANTRHELYLLCDDLKSEMASFAVPLEVGHEFGDAAGLPFEGFARELALTGLAVVSDKRVFGSSVWIRTYNPSVNTLIARFQRGITRHPDSEPIPPA